MIICNHANECLEKYAMKRQDRYGCAHNQAHFATQPHDEPRCTDILPNKCANGFKDCKCEEIKQ
jgi:hypothetical protein